MQYIRTIFDTCQIIDKELKIKIYLFYGHPVYVNHHIGYKIIDKRFSAFEVIIIIHTTNILIDKDGVKSSFSNGLNVTPGLPTVFGEE